MTILEDAKKIVDNDRNKEYGDLKPGFERIAAFWEAYLGVSIAHHDVAHMMMLYKIARLQGKPGHYDSLRDVAGFAYCAEKLTQPAPTVTVKTLDSKPTM